MHIRQGNCTTCTSRTDLDVRRGFGFYLLAFSFKLYFMDQGEFMVDLIDRDGNIIGNKKRKDIEKGVDAYHAVYCVVVTPKGELCLNLIANRQDMPNLHAGKFGCTAATIRRTGESAQECAKRAVEEELRIENEPELLHEELTEIDGTHRFIGWYKIEAEKPTNFSKEDIEDIKVYSKEDFIKLLEENPEKITPPLKKFWDLFSN